MPNLTRRDWLTRTSLALGATAALPGLLPASQMARALGDGISYTGMLEQLERDVTTARRLAGPVRLNYNENPFGMSPKAKDALMGHWVEHTWYAPPIRAEIAATFARHVGVPVDHVLVTQGSSEVLSIMGVAYGMGGGELVTPWPTFEDTPRWGDTMQMKVHRIPLDDRLDHDLYQMDARIGQSTRLVYVCNPNNPTSNLADDKALRDFVSNAAHRAPVIVDEAYIDFVDVPGHKSMVDLVLKGENIVVTRTASKIHGLAGLRVGFAIARPDILNKIKQYVSGDANVFGLHAANASLQDTEYQAFVKQRNTASRQLLTDTLTKLGKKVAPSQTNFVFFQAGKPTTEMQKYFATKGFTIGRPFPPYNDWCRVSIGTPEEMQQFCAVLPGAFS